MTLNKTGIEWTGGGFTWNPFSGCDHKFNKPVPTNHLARACDYCFANVIAEKRFKGTKAFPNGFAPTFHPDRLEDPKHVKIPHLIFAISMGDLYCPGVKQEWREQIFDSMVAYCWHCYLVLTKAPEKIENSLYGKEADYRLGSGDWYDHIWFGATIDRADALHRLTALRKFKRRTTGDCAGWHLFGSFEPLLEKMPKTLDLSMLDWVIIGQRTDPNNNPPIEWVVEVMESAHDLGIPVYIKNNLIHYFPDQTKRQLQAYPVRLFSYIHKW